MCNKCRGRGDGAMCTDCAAGYVAAVNEHCQWDHAVLMLDLDLKLLQGEERVRKRS